MGRVWSGVAVAALMVVGACTGAQGVAAADSGACETQSTTTIATDLSANGPLSSAVGCDSAQPVSGQAASSGGATSEPSGTIDTVAGGGIGDGGSALDAVFFLPSYETFDSSGNLYVSTHARVIKVTPSGIATTFAGTGTIGFQGAGGHHIYYGDGGPATAATFGDSGPSGLAFDSKGDLYIADSGDGVVRKVDTNGIITTVAGGGPISHYGIEGRQPAQRLSLGARRRSSRCGRRSVHRRLR